MEPFVVAFAGALALIAVLRTPRLTSPQLAFVLPASWTVTGPDEGDEDEQRPETDRAPVRRPLLWAVAALALARIVAFGVFHA